MENNPFKQHSFEQARHEAAEMAKLVGTTGTHEEYNEAEKIVESELVELYQNFDENFFYGKKTGSKPSNSELSADYRQMLGNPGLQDILSRKQAVETIDLEIIARLNTLTENEIKHSRYIQKCWKAQSLRRLLLEAGVDSVTEDQAEYIGSRPMEHLYRMIKPDIYYPDDSWRRDIPDNIIIQNTICPQFVKDYLNYIAKLENPNFDEAANINDVIGIEGPDVMAFWTLAPYVNDELKRDGFTAQDSIAKIFDWIKQTHKEGSKQKGAYFADQNNHFPYFYSKIGYYRHNFVLGLDERMPTHLLSRLYSKAIVEQMIKE